MSGLPKEVESRLSDPVYRRTDAIRTQSALRDLGINAPLLFRTFYERYAGPFSSRNTGFGLLDLFEQTPNVLSVTSTCRKEYSWPARLVVLTELLGGSVLVLDAETDEVFEVDFEGGDELLKSGNLKPSWGSFGEFLKFYFG